METCNDHNYFRSLHHNRSLSYFWHSYYSPSDFYDCSKRHRWSYNYCYCDCWYGIPLSNGGAPQAYYWRHPAVGSSHGDGVGNQTSSVVIHPAHEKGFILRETRYERPAAYNASAFASQGPSKHGGSESASTPPVVGSWGKPLPSTTCTALAAPDKGLPLGSEHQQPSNQTNPQPSISISSHKPSIKVAAISYELGLTLPNPTVSIITTSQHIHNALTQKQSKTTWPPMENSLTLPNPFFSNLITIWQQQSSADSF